METAKAPKSISLLPTSSKNLSKLISTMAPKSSVQLDHSITNSTSQKQPKLTTRWLLSKSRISVFPSMTDLSSIDRTISIRIWISRRPFCVSACLEPKKSDFIRWPTSVRFRPWEKSFTRRRNLQINGPFRNIREV
jgi:hypothetical protein